MSAVPSMTMARRFRGFLPVVVDVETGGFNAARDALLEIAAVPITIDADDRLARGVTHSFHVKPFEGANLDQAARWAAAFRRAGDERGALLQEEVARDERAHVAFAARWFERFAGPLDFEAWVASLPAPLSPLVLRGKELAREARLAGGLSAAFVDALERWRPAEEATGSRAAPGAREERP